jgi:hypothetical protein
MTTHEAEPSLEEAQAEIQSTTRIEGLDEFLESTGNHEVRQHQPTSVPLRGYVFKEEVYTD